MRTRSLLLTSSFAALLLGAAPAYAQVAGPPEVVVPPEEEEAQEDTLEEDEVRDATGADTSEQTPGTIVVTGSRIRLPNLESFEPIITLDEDYIENRNITNVADALNELPTYRGSVTPAGGQGTFGQGVNFVNNFGLGSNRTLTLVNGRRFVSSNVPSVFNNASQGTQVDLNVIPTILVDRIDTVAVGGAPVYGSDAISGTVNVILKTDYDDIELRGVSGVTEQGDNFRYGIEAVAGRNFLDDRLNITASLSHSEEEGVLENARWFLRENVGLVNNTLESEFRLNPGIGIDTGEGDDIPPFVNVRGLTIPYLSRGGVIFGGPLSLSAQFDPNGNLVPFEVGDFFPGGIFAAGGDGFQFSDFQQITSDIRRTIGNVFVNYEITDSLDFFAEGTWFESRADELVQQPTFNTVLFGGSSGALVFTADNPLLTDQAQQALADAGVGQFTLSRVSLDLADTTGFGENEVLRGVAGLRGDFGFADRIFNYEISANHGRAEITTFRQDINAQNFINAVNVTTDANGNIVCTTAPTRAGGSGFAAPGGAPIADPSCVPLNLFGENRASQEALDYVIEDAKSLAVLEQTVFNANIGGTLFDLWGAGWSGFNVGYEHRKESAEFTPSEFEQEGLGRSVAIGPVEGDFTIDALFGEVVIPLIGSDMNFPLINRAEVFGRGRYVHNSVNGGFFAWTAGGTVAPIRDLEFRGNFTRSFRAPAITELFAPQTNAFSTVPNPCENPGAGPAPEARARNCAAFLAEFPNANLDPASNATVPILTGGNPLLENEEADSYTFGAIIRPRFLPRFALTADYINIQLTGPISSLTVAQIVSGCFDNENFNTADPANGNQFCSLIRRHPAGTQGQLPTGETGDIGGFVIVDPANPAVTTGFVNGQRVKFEGVQSTLNYELPEDFLGIPGTFNIGGEVLYVIERVNDITGVAPQQSEGLIGDPEWAGQLRLRYNADRWGTAHFINYVGKQLSSRNDRGLDFREIDHLDAYATVDSSVWFDVAEKMRFTLSVSNLFDRKGEKYFGSYISVNDALGRRFAASARVRF